MNIIGIKSEIEREEMNEKYEKKEAEVMIDPKEVLINRKEALINREEALTDQKADLQAETL